MILLKKKTKKFVNMDGTEENKESPRKSTDHNFRSSVMESDHLKFVVIGPLGVGKSSVIQAIVGNPYNPDIKSTNCYEVHIKTFDVGERSIEVRLWDCSSYHNQSYSTVKKVSHHHKFKKAFYRGAVWALLVVEITNTNSALIESQVDEWVNESIDNEVT